MLLYRGPLTITGDFDASDGAARIMVADPYQMPDRFRR
jgi:hypothetical protein